MRKTVQTFQPVDDVKYEYYIDRPYLYQWQGKDANQYGWQGWDIVSATPYTEVDQWGNRSEKVLVVYKHRYRLVDIEIDTDEPDEGQDKNATTE